ncbi:hypothetical protein Q6348_10925 [Isoptericola sp. b441]|uniref:DivIVA domain-containing protein n=1 Tax=Actinotalea lenta TaxID=3064654 RepID=A0ABT9DBZ8_9CELL|nr:MULTISPECIES: hypothetical protein [unclassified Isoptericola]MDO8107708.1 hypothetical protein [Isoptericola sp. b441]MDO8120621.1 hypothetical protein [Isoptericola sp. b490]
MTETRTRRDFRGYVPEDVREHLETARQEMRKGVETFLPPEFFTHRNAARREMLLAWRGVLDAALRRMDEKGADAEV